MVDLTLFNDWAFSSGNVVALFVFMAISSNLLLLPFFIWINNCIFNPQNDRNDIIYMPLFLFLLVAPLSGYFTDRYNPALMTTSGTTILFVGLVAQSFFKCTFTLYQCLSIKP